MSPVEIRPGASPVILAFPHTGTDVPHDVAGRLNENGRVLADTDWHIHRLYDGLLPGATTVRATVHRYVIDANRDPAGASLYPGQNTTGLVPLTDFDGAPIWQAGEEPDEAEIARRLDTVHRPYHEALAAEIERVKALHGVAILYDCHSIRSKIPFLFEGVLPDFNIGTDGGKTCDPGNGRFRGGWTTRHYGRPDQNVHAIQMELAQATHLAAEAPPFAFEAEKAEPLRAVLSALLHRIEALAAELKG
jgi:N-formylglutamate deformylase